MTEAASVPRRWPFVVGTILVFSALSTYCSLTSQGFLEADSCAHFLYSRFAFKFPYFLVNVWGRPICTGVYAIPAAIGGRPAVHVMSLLLALGCGGLAWAVARQLNARWASLALLFTLAQPLVFLHSFSELTELPFAFLLALSTLLWLRGRFVWLAIIAGFLPLSRPEGFGFLGIFAVLLFANFRYWQILLLPLPLMAWTYAGHVLYNSPTPWWHWLIDEWPYSATSLYQRGNLFHFLGLMPAVASPFIFPATVIGIRRSFDLQDSFLLLIRRIIVAMIPLMIFVGHSVLFALGKMASSGEVRYMLIVAPFWGVLAALGWEWLFRNAGETKAYRWAAAAAFAPVLFNGYYRVLPLALDRDYYNADRAVVWFHRSGIAKDYPKFSTAQQEIIYLMDVSPTDGTRLVEWRRDLLIHPPPGTVAIYHPMYAIFNADSNRSVSADQMLQYGWIDVTDQEPTLGPGWKIFLSPQTASGAATPTTQRSPSNP